MSTVHFTLVVDMSPEAVAARLRDLGQLYALAKSLQQATPSGPAAAPTTSSD